MGGSSREGQRGDIVLAMELDARRENKLTLEAILGLTEEEAETILSEAVFINIKRGDSAATELANFLAEILARTVSSVLLAPQDGVKPSVEILIGNARPATEALHAYVTLGADKVEVSDQPGAEVSAYRGLHQAFLIVAACYIAAFAVRRMIGETERLPFRNRVVLDFKLLFPGYHLVNEKVNVGRVYLAGAGAVGNSFLYALKTLAVEGELVICDDDHVTAGNLNRCIWFDGSHLGLNKAKTLAKIAQPSFSGLKLLAHDGKLGTVPDKEKGGRWLEKLVVTVDSRRARRSLQSEIPKEVFDASTTTIDEACLHFSKRPLNGKACLECAYYQDPTEKAHERHIAEVLGLSVADIEEGNVSTSAASRIATKYPDYVASEIEGESYDSLFKELCGKDKIKMKDEEQILAPFAFVSVLAGTVLAIEFVQRTRTGVHPFNSWRLSPWSSPVVQLMQTLPRNTRCTFCNDNTKDEFANALWAK